MQPHRKDYCLPVGCGCGHVYNYKHDIYICKPCNCQCGGCVNHETTFTSCCPCGCNHGVCWRKPSFAIILSPKGYSGWFCCKKNCFPSIAKVSLESGKSITMDELEIGDRIQAGEHMHYSAMKLNIVISV